VGWFSALSAARTGRLLITGPIRVYRLAVSPFIPARCRFLPTCSDYSLTAIERFGVLKGTRLAAGRVCRCHPWGGSGIDEVPDLPDNR